MLPSGNAANALSGIVPLHIRAIQEVAKELDAALAFRQVNPHSAFWVRYGHAPVKGLNIKIKTQKEGALAGLLLSEGGRQESTVSLLEGDVFGAHLNALMSDRKLKILQEDEEDARYKSILAEDEKSRIYKFQFDQEEQKFSVFRKNGGEFTPVKFKGEKGVPLTADDDPFDFYPKLKEHFAGFKHLDPKTQLKGKALMRQMILEEAIKRGSPLRKWHSIAQRVTDDILELPEVRTQKGKFGRLTNIDRFIIEKINNKISELSKYPHEAVQHGKEKRNTQYPELCDGVFFVLPNGLTLMSTNWEQTQAVDYALKQEEFVSTDNRVYNIKAGTKMLFPDQAAPASNGEPLYKQGSGKTIPWDSRAAAETLYREYVSRPGKDASILHGGSISLGDAQAGRLLSAATSTASRQSEGSVQSDASSIPDWLCEFVRRTSVAPSVSSMIGTRGSSSGASGLSSQASRPSLTQPSSSFDSSQWTFDKNWDFSTAQQNSSTDDLPSAGGRSRRKSSMWSPLTPLNAISESPQAKGRTPAK